MQIHKKLLKSRKHTFYFKINEKQAKMYFLRCGYTPCFIVFLILQQASSKNVKYENNG